MKGNFLHPMPKTLRLIFYLSTTAFVFYFLCRFFPCTFVPHSHESAPLRFETPDFNPPPKEKAEEVPDNPSYQIEYTSRGAIRFRTEPAGSPAFGTPIPEMLPPTS